MVFPKLFFPKQDPYAGVLLESARYVSLSTYRREGSPVATAVWFVVQDGLGYFMTAAGTGKTRRLRRDPHVTITPSACEVG